MVIAAVFVAEAVVFALCAVATFLGVKTLSAGVALAKKHKELSSRHKKDSVEYSGLRIVGKEPLLDSDDRQNRLQDFEGSHSRSNQAGVLEGFSSKVLDSVSASSSSLSSYIGAVYMVFGIVGVLNIVFIDSVFLEFFVLTFCAILFFGLLYIVEDKV